MQPRTRDSGHAPERALIVANPYAGHARGRLDPLKIQAMLAAAGCATELGLTTGAGHARELAAAWAAAGHDLVVVVGGDGTVHEVAAGLMGTRCAMAVFPSGSGNDFAAGIGCRTVAGAMRAVTAGQTVQMDVAALDDHVFVNSCGLLASGLVSGRAAGYWRPLGSLRYVLAAARTLFSYRGQPVSWSLAGEQDAQGTTRWHGRYLLAEICNGPFTGGGFRFAPDASFDDGLLDAALLKPLGLLAGLKLLPSAAGGARLDHPALSVHRGREIAFESSEPVAYHVDGEPGVLAAGRHVVRILAPKLLVRRSPTTMTESR